MSSNFTRSLLVAAVEAALSAICIPAKSFSCYVISSREGPGRNAFSHERDFDSVGHRLRKLTDNVITNLGLDRWAGIPPACPNAVFKFRVTLVIFLFAHRASACLFGLSMMMMMIRTRKKKTRSQKWSRLHTEIKTLHNTEQSCVWIVARKDG